jgi:hypothetical protein
VPTFKKGEGKSNLSGGEDFILDPDSNPEEHVLKKNDYATLLLGDV